MPAASPSLWRYLPNAISLLRIVLILPISMAIASHQPRLALGLIALAGVSDGLDGFLARRYGWQSRFGGMLDAVADKLLLVACFLLLAKTGALPWWLAFLVLGRDLLIVSGALAWRLLIGPIKPQPSWLSKACTLAQILYLLAVLASAAGWPSILSPSLQTITAVLCVVSGLDYVWRWSWRAGGSRAGNRE
ncbi:CDP-alcohol phosphatidyltransferase family protein [Dyella tabacisoli]|uniref:CDP-diacylglycerol--glycerol-3-phosphate 3-phosphatidyltransferase n=1 Tax=Dyella tabacisoli TaxID=2282381 RepID=A0A369UH68_9GAMM|nr:CDP-alcohol phosphatidyltransferase family protein [Dyella tabacisoli]RDD80102.1 CDP-alcohol phosphatidyltransferase family protein [Dyella tabacisoli]